MTDKEQQIQFQIKRYQERWSRIHLIEEQKRLISDPNRNLFAYCGRRSGKTESGKIKIIKEACKHKNHDYLIGSPTLAQSMENWYEDLQLLLPPGSIAKATMTPYGKIKLINGTTIHVAGLDKAKRLEGKTWHGGILDEYADCKDDVWFAHLKAGFDSEFFDGTAPAWCWFLGTPDGRNHYYELLQDMKKEPKGWGFHTWHSSRLLSPEKIEEAKRTMSAKMFRQEYEASFETVGNRIYEDYSDNNVTDFEFNPSLDIYWCHDFNYNPLSSCLCQRHNGIFYVVDEIVLEGAIARNAATEFVNRYGKYKNIKIYIYGDASGKNGAKHGQSSNYSEIYDYLKAEGFQNVELRVPAANPPIKDRHNIVRAFIETAAETRALFVNNKKAPTLHEGLMGTSYKKGSTIIEVEDKNQHITTALGYMLYYFNEAERCGYIAS